MYIKAKKKLIAKCLENQNGRPKPLLPKRKEFKPVASPAKPIVEKFRGYKIKQVNMYKIDNCAPSVLF